ncbi:MAG: SpoIIIAC/SpoIIIAD family protein [Eubacteriales bacterium]
MEVVSVAGAAIFASVVCLTLKAFKSEYALLAGAAAIVIILASAVAQALPVVQYLSNLADRAGISDYFKILVKAAGIAVLCSCAADICRGAGESGIASAVETAGRLSILVMSLPVLKSILSLGAELLG